VVASSHGFIGLREGIEYCGHQSLDLYRPPGDRPAPVVVYVHGGGFMLGNRTMHGPWASAHADALFGPVRDRLAARGIAVASIDYRLLPGSDWRAPIEDVKCAVRYLRANAAVLRLDPNHIGAWGSSAGGTLVSLLALAPGFGTPQYADQPSSVQAVVNMFGPADLTRLGDSGGFARIVADLALGTDQGVRRALSPINYVTASAPPFLILHGDQDQEMPLALSQELATELQGAGVPATFVTVHGTGHSLATPTEQPSPDRVADQVAGFLEQTLS
jgi:acetyl esterase/lipase